MAVDELENGVVVDEPGISVSRPRRTEAARTQDDARTVAPAARVAARLRWSDGGATAPLDGPDNAPSNKGP